jgi:hypothetical protein
VRTAVDGEQLGRRHDKADQLLSRYRQRFEGRSAAAMDMNIGQTTTPNVCSCVCANSKQSFAKLVVQTKKTCFFCEIKQKTNLQAVLP